MVESVLPNNCEPEGCGGAGAVRGLIHLIQFALSYCVMLLFMYSNGI
jgi:hypothetical protein